MESRDQQQVPETAATEAPHPNGDGVANGKGDRVPSNEAFAKNLLDALVRFRDGDFGARMPSDLVGVEGKIAGDVAPEVWETAGWVSPNPGGVGPMTRAMLLANVVSIAEQAAGLA